jgi:hypothetical protein
MSEPGTRVVAEQEFTRVVDGESYRLVRISWNDTALVSWDIYAPDGECLTEDESLDDIPDDGQIRALAEEARRPYSYSRQARPE